MTQKIRKNIKHKIIRVLFSVCIFLVAVIVHVTANWTDTYVHIIMCDVGQGDSILIYRGFFQVLIDSGRNDGVLTCLQENIPFWDKNLEMIVVTHYDLDHIGGFDDVLDSYSVKTILAPTDTKDTNEYRELQIAFENEQLGGAIYKEPIFGDIISLQSGGSFTILSPWFDGKLEDFEEKNNLPDVSLSFNEKSNVESKSSVFLSFGEKSSDLSSLEENSSESTETELLDAKEKKVAPQESENNRSIVLLYEYDEISLLLTGDLEKQGEQALMNLGLITRVDLLKAGHHGAKTSSGDEFISKLAPEVALISAGKNNKFDHPSSETLDIYEKHGVLTVRTDELGDIEIITDGKTYWFDFK